MVTPTPRAGLKAIFARLANLPFNSVVWKGEPETPSIKAPASLAIAGATNASPIVLTMPQGLCVASGQPLTVTGVTGNTAANGAWNSVTVIDATHVSLDGSTGNGAYVSGGTAAPPMPWRNGLMRLSASSRDAEGWPDNRRTDNGNGTFSVQSVGRRRIMLSVDYFSFDPVLTIIADDVLEDVRTKILHPDILDALNQIGCAAITEGSIIPLPLAVNGSERSGAHLDFAIALAVIDQGVNEVGSVGGVNNWIGEVKGTGTITAVDGSTSTETIDVVGS